MMESAERITGEEAIKVLEDMKIKIHIPKQAIIQRKKNEALDLAIQALKAPQKPSRAEAVKRNYNQVNQEIMEATGCRGATTAQGFEIVNGMKISQSLINIDITLAELLDTIRAKDHEEEEGIAIGYHIDHYTPLTAEWLRTFDTDSATECFNAVQELKKIIEEKEP